MRTFYLNIIERYVYLNKFGSIACYLAHKETPLICINFAFSILLAVSKETSVTSRPIH